MDNQELKDVALEDVPCPNGCEKNDEYILETGDMLSGLPGTFTVVRCNTCGLMRTNPRPTAETIGFYYPDNYGPYEGTLIQDEEPNTSNAKWKMWLKRLLSSRSTETPSIPVGKMLEVGCASGSYLHKMAQLGWEVQGIEFSPEAAENARRKGYTVHTGVLENAPTPEKKFDLIVAWMVIEHLHEPVKSLRKLSLWANPQGYLVFSIPNTSNFFMNKYSYNLQLPTHLYHFSPNTITTLLKNTGWEVEKIEHQVTLSSLMASVGYKLRETRGSSWLSSWLISYPTRGGKLHYFFSPIALLLAKFGKTGRMTVWARKSSD